MLALSSAAVGLLLAGAAAEDSDSLNIRSLQCGGLGDPDDWLTHGCPTASTLTRSTFPDGSASFVLANGIVSRTLVANKSSGLLLTTSVATLAPTKQEKLRQPSPAPEALFTVNGIPVVVGGPAPVSTKLASHPIALLESFRRRLIYFISDSLYKYTKRHL
jgi:hypothetical protein